MIFQTSTVNEKVILKHFGYFTYENFLPAFRNSQHFTLTRKCYCEKILGDHLSHFSNEKIDAREIDQGLSVPEKGKELRFLVPFYYSIVPVTFSYVCSIYCCLRYLILTK